MPRPNFCRQPYSAQQNLDFRFTLYNDLTTDKSLLRTNVHHQNHETRNTISCISEIVDVLLGKLINLADKSVTLPNAYLNCTSQHISVILA